MPFALSLLSCLDGARELPAKSLKAALHAGVEHSVAHAQHDAADDVRIDPAGQLDAPAGLILDALSNGADKSLVELDRARHFDREHLVLLTPELVERPAYTKRSGEPVALRQ